MIQNQQIRKAFTRFRLGISQILTHKRRYTDENVVMLRCPLCNGETKNEVHLLATCTWYDHIHQKYLSERFNLEVFRYSCMYALAAQHSSSISAMSIYIFHALRTPVYLSMSPGDSPEFRHCFTISRSTSNLPFAKRAISRWFTETISADFRSRIVTTPLVYRNHFGRFPIQNFYYPVLHSENGVEWEEACCS